MAYPKPLAAKTIAKRYAEAGLQEEQIEFLRKFFTACANLYGRIPVNEVWEVYKEYAALVGDAAPKLKRKDVANAAAIMQREVGPFYVYDAEDLYVDCRNSDLNREILHPILVGRGYDKLSGFGVLLDHLAPVPYYVQADLLEYARPERNVSLQEKAFAAYFRKIAPNEEQYHYKRERIFDANNLGYREPVESLDDLMSWLDFWEVALTEEQVSRLMSKLMDALEFQHCWAKRGWSAYELEEARG